MITKYKKTFMRIAYAWAEESYCKRRKVGAVIVNENRDIAAGYNGTVSGADNCCEEEYGEPSKEETTKTKNLFGPNKEQSARAFCKKNNLIFVSAKADNDDIIITYQRPSLRTKASVVHAEANAIAFAAKKGISVENCQLFVTLSPCMNCANLIIQSGIKEVFYSEEYRNTSGIKYLRSNGIKVEQYEMENPFN